MANDLLSFLNQFAQVSPDVFAELISVTEHVRFGKKETMTDIGEPEMKMYYILSGMARKFFIQGKREHITHIVKEGGIIGSAASFFSGQPSKYIVEAMEPVTAISVSKQNLEELISSNKKWERIGRIIITHYFIIQERRQLDNLKYSTKERFVRFLNENPDLLLRVPQKYLASYLNIEPETFSRLKRLMIKEK
jgi:CRP-like cAMP-binding protein